METAAPLPAPRHAVAGVHDLEAAAAFFGALGMEELARWTLDPATARALHGVDGRLPAVELGAPGAAGGRVRLLRTPLEGAGGMRPLAIDIYTADLDRSLEGPAGDAAVEGSQVTLDLGPLVLRQCRLRGPDGLAVVLVEANRRRSSVLDVGEPRLHSEVHSVVVEVDDVASVLVGWGALAGFETAGPYPVPASAVARLMGWAGTPESVTMGLLAAPGGAPIRIELLARAGSGSSPAAGPPSLRRGIHGLGFRLAGAAAAAARLALAAGTTAPVVAPGAEGRDTAVVVGPGRLVVELEEA